MRIREIFRRLAVTRRDSRARLHFGEGDRWRDSGDWTKAANSYRLGLNENPAIFELWVQYGHALKESGQFGAAGEAYHKALEIRPMDADLHVQLGHYYKVGGETGRSVRHYRRAVELGSNDFEAFKGSDASFSTDGLAAALQYSGDISRPFVAREPKDIEALYCLLLGRRPSAGDNREQYLGLPLLAVADTIVGSEEFASVVVRPSLTSGALPHYKLAQEAWWLALEFLPVSGFLSGAVAGGDETLGAAALCRLGDTEFVTAAYWEVLWREPDAHGLAFNLGRLEAGLPKRQILEDLLASAEFRGLSRFVTVDWEQTADPVARRHAAAAVFVDLLSSPRHHEALESAAREWYLRALEAGAPRRHIAELILRRFGPEEHGHLGPEQREADWRRLLHVLFSGGPLSRILARRYSAGRAEFVSQLGYAPDAIRMFRNGSLALDVKTLMDLPEAFADDKLDRRAYEVYRELANLLLEQHPRSNAHSD